MMCKKFVWYFVSPNAVSRKVSQRLREVRRELTSRYVTLRNLRTPKMSGLRAKSRSASTVFDDFVATFAQDLELVGILGFEGKSVWFLLRQGGKRGV